MFITVLFIASYLIIASFALFMTFEEQKQTGDRSLLLKMLGFLACMLWPITFLTVAVAAQRSTS